MSFEGAAAGHPERPPGRRKCYARHIACLRPARLRRFVGAASLQVALPRNRRHALCYHAGRFSHTSAPPGRMQQLVKGATTMIKDIVKDEEFLSRPAEPATAEDADVAQDLRDTMESLGDCVCLAANQIGSTKAIIAYEDAGRIWVMYNPKLKACAQPYDAMEGCVSRDEPSQVKRYRMIRVSYQVLSNGNLVSRTKQFTNWCAEIVQHGLDHLAGKLV